MTQQPTQRQGCQVTQDSRQVDNNLKKIKNKKTHSAEQCYNAQTTNGKPKKFESNQTSEPQSFLSQFGNVESR